MNLHRKLSVLVSTLVVVLLLGACSPSEVPSADAIESSASGRDCIERDVGGESDDFICIERTGPEAVTIDARGLSPGSAIKMVSSNGNTVESSADATGLYRSDVEGAIASIDSEITVSGTWGDLTDAEISVFYSTDGS